MIDEITADAEERMQKSLAALDEAFKRIRTGRAHPSILDSVMVSYYGSDTPLNQLANVNVEEGRTLIVSPWEKPIIADIERAIMKSDLGLNPSNNGDTIRVPMPALTEETRCEYTNKPKMKRRMLASPCVISAAMPIRILKTSRKKKRSAKMSSAVPKT